MSQIMKYLQIAVENEEVFRNILRDLKNNKGKRPMGVFIPDDLDTEAHLNEIFRKYSEGDRTGIFTIIDFKIKGATAIIGFKDVAILSGGGASLKYKVNENKTVTYLEPESTMMSLR